MTDLPKIKYDHEAITRGILSSVKARGDCAVDEIVADLLAQGDWAAPPISTEQLKVQSHLRRLGSWKATPSEREWYGVQLSVGGFYRADKLRVQVLIHLTSLDALGIVKKYQPARTDRGPIFNALRVRV